MKKIHYIAPTLTITHCIGMESIMQTSGPGTSNSDANQDDGMDVKVDRRQDFNVWNDDWSK